jgi:hypothetical protein
MEMLRGQLYSLKQFAGHKAYFEYVNSARGFWLSERAVAARYSNHHFNAPHYLRYQMEYEYRRMHHSEFRNNEYMQGRSFLQLKERYEKLKAKEAKGRLTAKEQEEMDMIRTTAELYMPGATEVQFFNQNKLLAGYGDQAARVVTQRATSSLSPGGPSN